MFSGISRLFFHIARRISFLEATSENSIQANFAEFLFYDVDEYGAKLSRK
jgi:hypothetical protein